jgi:single-strand DNA-binding protein
MNRWTGTAHLTRDPELVTTSGGTEICEMRIAVKRAARDGEAGFFDVKAFGAQAVACAKYLAKGREVALEARLRFEEFETKAGGYAQRVYLIADQVEFLASRRPSDQPDNHAPHDDQHDENGQPAEPAPAPERQEAQL